MPDLKIDDTTRACEAHDHARDDAVNVVLRAAAEAVVRVGLASAEGARARARVRDVDRETRGHMSARLDR
jgi:hypothetical protein